MRTLSEREQALLNAAHQVLTESRQLMLPHHFSNIGPRLETFDEMRIHAHNATGVKQGRFVTNILLLTYPGERPTLSHEMTHQDTVIVDLSAQQPDLDQMRRFLLTTEQARTWHHAPWLVINLMKQGKLGNR